MQCAPQILKHVYGPGAPDAMFCVY